ncbi:MAG: peptidoglycan DD-metalloendopeptidase family protein [Chloroflexi bacterium]|nr:peptidoglycan DD-metalloendopeptidase family protein [Chloroflexota bacterium]
MNFWQKSLTAVPLCLLFLMTGCRQTDPSLAPLAQQPSPKAAFTLTATPLPTASPTPPPTASQTPVPSPTPSPSPTATATATAVPLSLNGNPRAAQLANLPPPQRAAACGVVDILDFPIDPPDAANVSRGGGDFGVFRDRYGKYHAGEDWGAPGGLSNFGHPVYNIGHGRVMYAESEGWNRDKGVVIIEHVLADGRSFYSFYGHLDPPSVLLEPGDCIQRGQTVGNIGRPRSSPHLHFEVRTHMPYTPGPGYWPEDPTTAGWLPPSQTIWNQRMAGAPGVLWLRPFLPNSVDPIGQPDAATFLLREGEQVTAVGLADGRWQPLRLDGEAVYSAVLSGEVLIVADREGQVRAFGWLNGTAEPMWRVDLGVNGALTLWPLPGGGLVAGLGTRLWGLADGAVQWTTDEGARPLAWAATDDALLLSTTGSDEALWAITGAHPPQKIAPFSGYPLVAAGVPWLVSANGLYRLAEGSAAELVMALHPAQLRRSTAAALPDGGLLLAHSDPFDQRLIALDGNGSLRWQRSFAGLSASQVTLLTTNSSAYLAARGGNGELKVYAVDAETAVLTHIFTGGTRSGGWGDGWVTAVGDNLLLYPGGGSILTLDPESAQDQINAIRP